MNNLVSLIEATSFIPVLRKIVHLRTFAIVIWSRSGLMHDDSDGDVDVRTRDVLHSYLSNLSCETPPEREVAFGDILSSTSYRLVRVT